MSTVAYNLLDELQQLSKVLTPRLKRARRVALLWMDAWADLTESSPEEHKHEAVYYVTEGFLIKSDEKGVSLAQELGPEGSYRGRTFIPRSLVVLEWEQLPLRLPRRVVSHEKEAPAVCDPGPGDPGPGL